VDESNMNIPSDVVVIKDSFSMSYDFYGSEKEYLVSRNYIGFRYVSEGDTIIEEPVPGFPPNVMKEIHSYGKDIIPYLISHIDIKQNGIAGFINPYDSYLSDKILGSPLGVNYAYMIELIMAKDTIMDNIHYAEGNDIWYEKMKLYRLYGQCVIISKLDLNNPKDKKINFDDMKTIKAYYIKWWESNKDENLDTLRKKWREEGSPLQNSPYMWI
ncbi:MAG: hypothetical protein J5682_08535, partial [Prevotella sp.]|nr:hypothetical protein [Prevotella sp.]